MSKTKLKKIILKKKKEQSITNVVYGLLNEKEMWKRICAFECRNQWNIFYNSEELWLSTHKYIF